MESPITFLNNNFDNLRLYDDSHEISVKRQYNQKLNESEGNFSSSLGSADSQTSTIYSLNNSPQKDYNIIYGGSNDNILEESFTQDRPDVCETKPKSQRTLEFLVEAEEEMLSIWKSSTKKAIVKPIIQNLQQTTCKQNQQNIQASSLIKQESQNTHDDDYTLQNAQWHYESEYLRQEVPERPSNPVPSRSAQINYYSQNPVMHDFNQQLPQYQQIYYQSFEDFNQYCESDLISDQTNQQDNFYTANFQTQQYSQDQAFFNYQYQQLQFSQQNQMNGFSPFYYTSFQNEESQNFYNYTQTIDHQQQQL
ncbi:UNKNOWN [Stylonychia lemnae]|uniref:Uncharacterized protein n=1 Tax=Stylonychia lemnae TaxID=5949 RepID=A0A078B351_STYLE|nr:UNKNOWN [Stylonychia lemnae]|eukprot:CDW87913.1 UNKNOWN [Stylonychia lemnae]